MTCIRKYKTTKTTTTTQHGTPPQPPPPLINSLDQFNSQNIRQMFEQKMQQQQSNQTQQNNSFRTTATTRSSSIPPSTQRSQFIDQNMSSSNLHQQQQPGSVRYFSSKNYTTSNSSADRNAASNLDTSPRPLIEKKSTISSKAHKSSSSNYEMGTAQQQQVSKSNVFNVNDVVLPQNHIQTQYQQNQLKQQGLSSASCIDYSNSYYNSDWAMRHGCIDKSAGDASSQSTAAPIQIPIYQKQQMKSNSTSAFSNSNNNHSKMKVN